MSDDYPEYEKLPRDNKVCGNFLSVLHQNQTGSEQKLKVSVDVAHMSTPSIRLWLGKDTPDPQSKRTDPVHTFVYNEAATGSVSVSLPKDACLWAAASSDGNRVHLLRIVRGSDKK